MEERLGKAPEGEGWAREEMDFLAEKEQVESVPMALVWLSHVSTCCEALGKVVPEQ